MLKLSCILMQIITIENICSVFGSTYVFVVGIQRSFQMDASFAYVDLLLNICPNTRTRGYKNLFARSTQLSMDLNLLKNITMPMLAFQNF